MRRERHAKIIATLGPSSSTAEQIEMLARTGADVFRLNFSHGSHEDHRARYNMIRAAEEKTGRPISIIMDLQGPKLRVGTFAQGKVTLENGQDFCLDMDKTPGDKTRVCLPHPEIFAVLKVGTELLMDDGKIRVRVTARGENHAMTTVVVGGTLSNNKGLNVPGEVLPISALTEKDRKDLMFGLSLGVDWVALSFVQRAEDVAEARALTGNQVGIISKLEKPQAITALHDIVNLSDAVMVARGDLGVECPPEVVPILQKKILSVCRQQGKPVVVATQMLESMISAPTPTRAEASDVATAVYDGADAVMLSAETAAGQYPVEAVSIMSKIIASVEHDETYRQIINSHPLKPENTAADAICAAASQVAATVEAKAIVTFTSSGSTAFRQARQRPPVPILGLTPDVRVARQLALVWGIHAVTAEGVRDFGDMVQKATRLAERDQLAQAGDKAVIIAGVPFGTPGSTNVLRIAEIGDNL
ncbi:pyruvate kinase [Haematospirillum sp. H1815]|uniref:pyruvate kinase n=1 Tax=Haematospirillum sp. H1815 TaxID=2723108 RepID=UPI00143C5A09|nr:pyruvate kinase [Haematospirillum sp. H1815]NKD76570.1 pyruvate kinase [Haematospirillum sp. H1815]